MILGIGNDLVDGRRIERLMAEFGPRFLSRCFTPTEQTQAQRRGDSAALVAFYARRFAAKEACAKALGTGFRAGIAFNQIGVVSDASGKPDIALSGRALERLVKITPEGARARIHLTLTDEPPYAQAFVVIESV